MASAGCWCQRLRAGEAVGQRGWDDLCPVHGVGTSWFRALPRLPFGFAGERDTVRAEYLWSRQGLAPGRGPLRSPGPGLAPALSRCRECQDWYRDLAEAGGLPRAGCAGKTGDGSDPVRASAAMCAMLAVEPGDRRLGAPGAARELIRRAENLGVLVLVSPVPGPGEFRSITLIDRVAPLIFLNSPAGAGPGELARAFLHALVRLQAGESALDHDRPGSGASHDSGQWCGEVTREVLCPCGLDMTGRDARQLAAAWGRDGAMLRHLAGPERAGRNAPLAPGGLPGSTPVAHVSRALARAVAASTAAGQTPYRDAFRMLGAGGRPALDEPAEAPGQR